MKTMKNSRSIEKQSVLSLLEAADRVRRHYNEILAPSDLTLQQYNILRILQGAGKEGLPTLEVGARMIEKTPGVTRLLDRMERKDLVQRVRNDKDRRQVFCHISGKGAALLAELEETISESDRQCVAGLSKEEQSLLQTLASRVGL